MDIIEGFSDLNPLYNRSGPGKYILVVGPNVITWASNVYMFDVLNSGPTHDKDLPNLGTLVAPCGG